MINCPNAIIEQCISNAYYDPNSLIGYKVAYFRSYLCIDIYNCDVSSEPAQCPWIFLVSHS